MALSSNSRLKTNLSDAKGVCWGIAADITTKFVGKPTKACRACCKRHSHNLFLNTGAAHTTSFLLPLSYISRHFDIPPSSNDVSLVIVGGGGRRGGQAGVIRHARSVHFTVTHPLPPQWRHPPTPPTVPRRLWDMPSRTHGYKERPPPGKGERAINWQQALKLCHSPVCQQNPSFPFMESAQKRGPRMFKVPPPPPPPNKNKKSPPLSLNSTFFGRIPIVEFQFNFHGVRFFSHQISTNCYGSSINCDKS